MRDWLDGHPEARPLHLAYFGSVDPRIAGIDYLEVPRVSSPTDALSPGTGAPTGPTPGWHAVSVNYLRGFVHHSDASLPPQGDAGYAYFLRWAPVARAGYSIYIYRVTPAEAAEARRDLGLPAAAE